MMKNIQGRKVFYCISLLVFMYTSSIYAQKYELETNWDFINKQSLQADEKTWQAAPPLKDFASLRTLDNVIITGESGGKKLYFNGYITNKTDDRITVLTSSPYIAIPKQVVLKKAIPQPSLEEKNKALETIKDKEKLKEPQDPTFIEQLLDAGADVFAVDFDKLSSFIKSTSLRWAISKNNQKVFEFLLSKLKEDEINLKIKDITPLYLATFFSRKDMVQKLLDAGADTSENIYYSMQLGPVRVDRVNIVDVAGYVLRHYQLVSIIQQKASPIFFDAQQILKILKAHKKNERAAP